MGHSNTQNCPLNASQSLHISPALRPKCPLCQVSRPLHAIEASDSCLKYSKMSCQHVTEADTCFWSMHTHRGDQERGCQGEDSSDRFSCAQHCEPQTSGLSSAHRELGSASEMRCSASLSPGCSMHSSCQLIRLQQKTDMVISLVMLHKLSAWQEALTIYALESTGPCRQAPALHSIV